MTSFQAEGDRGRQEFFAREPSRPKFVVDAGHEAGQGEHGQACARTRDASPVDRGENDNGFGQFPPDPTLRESSPEESHTADRASEKTPGDSSFVAPSPHWRDLVSAKVSSHRSQRPRKPRYPSLEFEPAASRWRASTWAPGAGKATFRRPAAEEPREVKEQKSQAEAPLVFGATARVLEFPRLVPMPVRRDELAEPLIERPRIVEAPELLPPPPAMGGILIETDNEPEPLRRPGFEIPLESAPLDRRLWSGLVDGTLVTAAIALFGYVFFRISGIVPPPKTILQIGAGAVALLWPAYQYALLVFSGTTPGLRLTRMQVLGFDGSPPSRRLRRWRVLASLLSSASLGLGYAWCFLDEDQLSWHDRITRTHLAERSSQKK